MAKKRATKKQEEDLQVDALLEDISSPPEPKETNSSKEEAPASRPTDYHFAGDQKRMSKKKREELKLKFNSSNRNDTLGQMMKGMETAARSRFNSASVVVSV